MALGVLIDLSGTLHIEDEALPGAVEALRKLRHANIPIRFCTNTTKESGRALHERLLRCGFQVERSEIFSSLTAARHLILKEQLRPYLMLEESAKEDFADIPSDNPNAVVIGLAPSLFHYEALNTAFRLLLDGAALIGIHKGRYYARGDGLALGPGAFVAALEYSAKTEARVVGKPTATFFHSAIAGMGLSPDQVLMIGDDVLDDVIGAQVPGGLQMISQRLSIWS